jgi:hypothetical protein
VDGDFRVRSDRACGLHLSDHLSSTFLALTIGNRK